MQETINLHRDQLKNIEAQTVTHKNESNNNLGLLSARLKT